jgi:hypothetical protein
MGLAPIEVKGTVARRRLFDPSESAFVSLAHVVDDIANGPGFSTTRQEPLRIRDGGRQLHERPVTLVEESPRFASGHLPTPDATDCAMRCLHHLALSLRWVLSSAEPPVSCLALRVIGAELGINPVEVAAPAVLLRANETSQLLGRKDSNLRSADPESDDRTCGRKCQFLSDLEDFGGERGRSSGRNQMIF